MNPLSKQYADSIASAIEPREVNGQSQKYELGPLLIAEIVLQVIGCLMQCWTFFHPSASAQSKHTRLVAKWNRPKSRANLIRRTAVQFQRRSSVPLSWDSANVFAVRTLEKAVAVSPDEMEAYAASCGSLPISEHAAMREEAQDFTEEE